MVSIKFNRAVFIAFAIVSAMVTTASAAVFDTPVYDPVSKKYYALVNVRAPNEPYPRNEGFTWELADSDARSRTYRGVQGRLAVVNSIGVHEFLLQNFHSDVEAWIGLRYWCKRHKLQWSDGTYLDRGTFSAWDPVWKQDSGACNSDTSLHPKNAEQFMPVAYGRFSFRWIGKGWGKRYVEYFIEFPTGHP